MCGRFLLEPRTPQVVRQFFDVTEELDYAPRWNMAPTQESWVVRRSPEGGREIANLRWGLVPSWAKDAAAASRLINARSETAAEKPSFRSAWKARRCVVPSTGWYEWRTEGGRKQPWLLRAADSEFTAFAGLWEHWQSSGQPALESFTILTAPAIPELAELHHRMPVVLHRDWIAAWLDDPHAGVLPQPQDYAGMHWERHAVSTRVNSPRHDDQACALPLTEGA